MWVTASQDVQAAAPEVNNPGDNSYNDAYGAFGYNGSLYYSDPWGPFTLTPSGMVQMAMDGIGRTNNLAFGAASNAPDQRFNSMNPVASSSGWKRSMCSITRSSSVQPRSTAT